MIIKDEEALKRLNSPMNLINKLKSNNSRSSAMSLFGVGRKEVMPSVPAGISVKTGVEYPVENTSLIPSQTTSLDTILENHESQIKLGLAHDNALALLNTSVSLLSSKLDDVRADKLPAVISSASKVVESIRKERAESAKNGKDREVHYHFYTPNQKSVSDYEVIEVGAAESR